MRSALGGFIWKANNSDHYLILSTVPQLSAPLSLNQIKQNIHHTIPVLKIRTICQERDLWKLAWSCKLYAHHTHEIYQVLTYSVDFLAPRELWYPLNMTVYCECSFIWNKGAVYIWNDPKGSKLFCTSDLYIFFLIFDTALLYMPYLHPLFIISPSMQLYCQFYSILHKHIRDHVGSWSQETTSHSAVMWGNTLKLLLNINGLVQEICDSSVVAMELRLSHINPLIYTAVHLVLKPIPQLMNSFSIQMRLH